MPTRSVPLNRHTLPPEDITSYVSEAVRRRIRARWERRRAATDPRGQVLTVVGENRHRPGRAHRMVANTGTVERCLTRPAAPRQLFAMIERTDR